MKSNWLYIILFCGSKSFYYRRKYFSSYNSWKKCKFCKSYIFYKKLYKNFMICYKCGFHFNIKARDRALLFFSENFFEIHNTLLPIDFFNFFDVKYYYSRIVESQMKTREFEALLIFKGKIKTIDVIICIFEFEFIGGSMGYIVGEKFLNAIKFCIKHKLPLICFASSGGVRMQESVISLLQMSKVSYGIKLLSQNKLPYFSVIVNPCMGGVSASIAMLGDINIAEPNALIGFTGPRVIKNIVGKNLPIGFQSSEFLLYNGFLDFIIDRKHLYSKIWSVLNILMKI